MVDPLGLLLDALDATTTQRVGTSVRLPENLRVAAEAAAELGLTASTTDLTVEALRAHLEGLAQRAVLDAHYRQHPNARPNLAEVAQAYAELNDDPLRARPDLVAAAAVQVYADDPAADAHDVLVYARALARHDHDAA